MAGNSLEVSMLGTSFTVTCEEGSQHLKQVVDFLQGKVREAQSRFRSYDPVKISLLVSLNLADELLRHRNAPGATQGQEGLEIERITEQLIDKIDRSLSAGIER
jgi:cell division protein ZapA (FtsZ GTPase activity inhibitor)